MLEINLDTKDLERGLAQLLKNATDNRPMMRGIATELVASQKTTSKMKAGAVTNGNKANAPPATAAKPCKKAAN